jgi:hypothetical protein
MQELNVVTVIFLPRHIKVFVLQGEEEAMR